MGIWKCYVYVDCIIYMDVLCQWMCYVYTDVISVMYMLTVYGYVMYMEGEGGGRRRRRREEDGRTGCIQNEYPHSVEWWEKQCVSWIFTSIPPSDRAPKSMGYPSWARFSNPFGLGFQRFCVPFCKCCGSSFGFHFGRVFLLFFKPSLLAEG